MATKKKMLQAAAGSAGGAGLDVNEVFSTYLYTGTAAAQTITNGIDLDGEGGIVWLKNRTSAVDHRIVTPEISPTGASDYYVIPNSTAGRAGASDMISSFNSNGFSLDYGYSQSNQSGQDYASWTWRKAPKFFDCVTYTGNGTTQTISHNLGATVGTLIVKKTTAGENWVVYHRSLSVSNQEYLQLNLTSAVSTNGRYLFGNNTIMVAPTSTQFTLGQSAGTNENGATYVAYLFAHNDGDGEFGPDGDADIIKCGSYTGNGNDDGPEIDLGFEPQWVMVKNTIDADGWYIFDNMRGMFVGGIDQGLRANSNDQEYDTGEPAISPTPTGFKVTTNQGWINNNNVNIIYMAIRRGPLAPPEAGTEVFAIDTSGSSAPYFDSGFPVDMSFWRPTSSANTQISSRITGNKRMYTNLTASEGSSSAYAWDYMDGWYNGGINNEYSWMWKRAPSYFDVVAYTGNGTAGHTVSHNLGVEPEMMWVKRRDAISDWNVYNQYVAVDPETDYLILNATAGPQDASVLWNDTAPSSSEFTLGNNSQVNNSGGTYIAYLFASLDNISKLGSYTGNGSSQTINCGFTSGARFVLIKRLGSDGWIVFDSVRGITSSSADPYLYLNNTDSEATGSFRDLNPTGSGFILNGGSDSINASGDTYIFYAIA